MLKRPTAILALTTALLCASFAGSPAYAARFEPPPPTSFRPATRALDLVAQAAQFLGRNPTGWTHDFCAYGLNRFVLAPLGLRQGTNMAGSFLAFPRTTPHRNAIAVLSWHRGRADHVGIVEGIDAGRIRIISFNTHNHIVGRGTVRPSQVLAFVEALPGRSAAWQASVVPWPIYGHRHKHRYQHRVRRHHYQYRR